MKQPEPGKGTWISSHWAGGIWLYYPNQTHNSTPDFASTFSFSCFNFLWSAGRKGSEGSAVGRFGRWGCWKWTWFWKQWWILESVLAEGQTKAKLCQKTEGKRYWKRWMWQTWRKRNRQELLTDWFGLEKQELRVCTFEWMAAMTGV